MPLPMMAMVTVGLSASPRADDFHYHLVLDMQSLLTFVEGFALYYFIIEGLVKTS